MSRAGRKRPSGVGSNSRRFAQVRMPDGRDARVPAAKDAATYLCLATPTGDWPDKALVVLLYDVTWLVEGGVLELEELRPGHGMGSVKTLRVVNSRTRVQLHEGNYGQMQRWLLCVEVASGEAVDNATPDDLDGN